MAHLGVWGTNPGVLTNQVVLDSPSGLILFLSAAWLSLPAPLSSSETPGESEWVHEWKVCVCLHIHVWKFFFWRCFLWRSFPSCPRTFLLFKKEHLACTLMNSLLQAPLKLCRVYQGGCSLSGVESLETKCFSPESHWGSYIPFWAGKEPTALTCVLTLPYVLCDGAGKWEPPTWIPPPPKKNPRISREWQIATGPYLFYQAQCLSCPHEISGLPVDAFCSPLPSSPYQGPQGSIIGLC